MSSTSQLSVIASELIFRVCQPLLQRPPQSHLLFLLPQWASCLGSLLLRAPTSTGTILTLTWRGRPCCGSTCLDKGTGVCFTSRPGGPHLRDEDQSQGGGDCAVGVEEEEEEGPVRVQGGNQHKPESGMGGRFLSVGRSGLFPLTSLTCPSPSPDRHGDVGGVRRALFPLLGLSGMWVLPQGSG